MVVMPAMEREQVEQTESVMARGKALVTGSNTAFLE
jgi:hypothetical protein